MVISSILINKKTDSNRETSPLSLLQDNSRKPAKKFTVFIVEDDIDDRNLMLHTLRQSPYISKIHCFGSGDKLIGHIALEGYYGGGPAETSPTLLLLDIHLPGANGIEILEELKDHPSTSRIPVLIVTNDISREKFADAVRLKANGYLNKPIDLDKIHEAMIDMTPLIQTR